MTRGQRKLQVLTFVGNYLPGYKAGGILRSLVNTVDHLAQNFEFRIITRDRDLGDSCPYQGVAFNRWQRVKNAEVLYFHPPSKSLSAISRLIRETPHDVVYLNSFFDSFTIKVLLIRRFTRTGFRKVIVAPRGEFAWGALGQKRLKKALYIRVARLLDLYQGVTWHASSEFEARDITKVMMPASETIHTALDLPTKGPAQQACCTGQVEDGNGLRVVFLSRIARVKNLKDAIEILGQVKRPVTFHIYGPIEAQDYWKECCELIADLPETIEVQYLGCVEPGDVVQVFSRYDLFLLPTHGENYGHVIAEALTAGTPVLISNETPWRNLEEDGLGWDLPLADLAGFSSKIEALASLSAEERRARREVIRNRVAQRLLDPEVLAANRELFLKASVGEAAGTYIAYS